METDKDQADGSSEIKMDKLAADAQDPKEEEELEEGELKDDDDDDDDDDEINQQGKSEPKKASYKDSSDDSDSDRQRSGTNLSETISNEVKKPSPRTSSTRSSSPSTDHIKPLSFRSRHGSDSRHSSRSHSRAKRTHSPSNSSQQARLITMRAKLLEAKSREIEMKFQKNKTRITPASPISSTITLTSSRNLKTTIAKPPITYAENPNPTDLSPVICEKSKSSKSSKKEKSRSSKKSSKKRKKKSSSSSKKKKRSKTSVTPKKNESNEPKVEVSTKEETVALDIVDHQGPKTPPDNQVLTVDDEQVEWPSYLIKMTLAQPSISYSVNPDSVARNNPKEPLDTADLDSDFNWYYNYFMNTYQMDKSQAQHQACSIIISSGCYGDEKLKRWLEQQGFCKQLDNRNDILQRDSNGDPMRESANLPLRTNKPAFTILRSLKEITLPNGKVLPRGTIQKIVHPYPRQDRVIPEVTSSFSDLH